jgi:hypothetical protein
MKMKGVQEGAGMNPAKKKQAEGAGRPNALLRRQCHSMAVRRGCWEI